MTRLAPGDVEKIIAAMERVSKEAAAVAVRLAIPDAIPRIAVAIKREFRQEEYDKGRCPVCKRKRGSR